MVEQQSIHISRFVGNGGPLSNAPLREDFGQAAPPVCGKNSPTRFEVFLSKGHIDHVQQHVRVA